MRFDSSVVIDIDHEVHDVIFEAISLHGSTSVLNLLIWAVLDRINVRPETCRLKFVSISFLLIL